MSQPNQTYARGDLKGQKWICSHAENLKPCHAPAVWVVQCGQLALGACHRHVEAVRASVTPIVRTWDVKWLTGEGNSWLPEVPKHGG